MREPQATEEWPEGSRLGQIPEKFWQTVPNTMHYLLVGIRIGRVRARSQNSSLVSICYQGGHHPAEKPGAD